MSGQGLPSEDFHANGVEAPTGRFSGYTATGLDESHSDSVDDGYDWHAPQTLAPSYGDESDAAASRSSAQAWWDQVRNENGLGGSVAAPTEAPAPNGIPSAPSGYPELSDHTEAISPVGPADVEPTPEPAAEYVPAYNGAGQYQQPEQNWQQTPNYGTPSSPTGVPEAPSGRAAAGPRRARLGLRRIDPWSTLKFSLVLAVALFVVWMVAIGVLYGVLSGMGVFDKLNSTVNEVNGSTGKVVTPQIVLGLAGVIGGVSIVLFTALATVGSFIYNLCADMVGGLEVTLAERD
jgi:hypothetical protein